MMYRLAGERGKASSSQNKRPQGRPLRINPRIRYNSSMAVKIRLARVGRTGRPNYRIVAIDESKKRSGRPI